MKDTFPQQGSERPRWLSTAGRLSPIVDQGAYSIANLLLQIALARALTPSEFGAFAISQSILLVALILQQTCISEPMLVLHARRYKQRGTAYLSLVTRQWIPTFALATGAVFLLAAATLLLWSSELSAAFVGVAFAGPATVVLWHVRRLAYAMDRPWVAAGASVAYFVLTCGLIAASLALAWISALVGGLVMAFGAAGAVLAVRQFVQTPRLLSRSRRSTELVRHLRYGLWAFAAEMINWLLVSLPILALPIWLGLEAAGAFRLLTLLFMPLQQVAGALASIRLVHLAGLPVASLMANANRSFRWYAGASVAYAFLVLVFFQPLTSVIAGDAYSLPFDWVAAVSVAMVAALAAQPYILALRARENTRVVVLAYVAVLVTSVLCLPASLFLGPLAVLIGQALGWLIGLSFAYISLQRYAMMHAGLAPIADRSHSP